MKELWKDIEGFEGLYQISNYGRVKSLERERHFGNRIRLIPERILTPDKKKSGYLFYHLYLGGRKQKDFHAHRLVAQAFIPNPLWKKDVNHKDGNKSNNYVENLEWATRSENILHSYHVLNRKATKLYGSDNKMSIPIVQLSIKGEFIKEWANSNEVQRAWGVSEASIRKCLYTSIGKKQRANCNSCCGYKWMYAKDYYAGKVFKESPEKVCKPLRQIDIATGKTINVFYSAQEMQRTLGFGARYVAMRIHHKDSIACGFKWAFCSVEEYTKEVEKLKIEKNYDEWK